MSKRGRIALVACESCRARKIRCDGDTPVCGPCQAKLTTCVYSSDPSVPRSAALKSEHEQLKSSYGNLSTVFGRLKYGSTVEASELLNRIRSEDEISGLSGDEITLRRSGNQDRDARTRNKHEESRAVPPARLRQETSSPMHLDTDASAQAESIRVVDPFLSSDLDEPRAVLNSPTASSASSQLPGLNECQTSESTRKDSPSHISVSHRVLLWPAVVCHMKESGIAAAASSDLQCIEKPRSPWLLQRETSQCHGKLPCDIGLPHSTLRTGSVVFPGLTIQRLDDYSSAYFNTFNVLLPLLDRDMFMDRIAARLLREGYRDDDPESVLALLVLALGQLAIEGVTGASTGVAKDELSGFRGGTIEKLPGLRMFNEARRRIGMVNTQPCLENVQIMLLQATYFESSARHFSFWSSTSAASLACMCLVKSQQIDWASPHGDLVKRAYWACVVHERLFDIDFRMSSTGIESLEDRVPLPHFHGMVRRGPSPGGSLSDPFRFFPVDEQDGPAFHFIAMITLSRLIRRADEIIHGYEPKFGDAEVLWQLSDLQQHVDIARCFQPPNSYTGPPLKLVQELLNQLDCWRRALPQRLQWDDSYRFDFTEIQPLTAAIQNQFFSRLQNLGPSEVDHNVDMAVVQLRTRFYHARFLICRPFIFKALHFPGLMTADDRFKCASAIDAACNWPLSLAPPKNKKHLVPHLFSWTQNFLAMVLVLRACRKSSYLGEICKENGTTEGNLESAISSMMQWLEDARQVDGVADWCLSVFGPALAI